MATEYSVRLIGLCDSFKRERVDLLKDSVRVNNNGLNGLKRATYSRVELLVMDAEDDASMDAAAVDTLRKAVEAFVSKE